MEILHHDRDILVCIKPPQILSTDEPGGLPDLLRRQLGEKCANLRTVHRLDRVVSGLMVLATRAKAASDLSRQIREGSFQKEYLAVVHGTLTGSGTLRDLLARDPQTRRTYVTDTPGKDAREAVLCYQVLGTAEGMTLLRIQLVTGRTHQIRVQFSSRELPLVGDRKYGRGEDCDIALWSCRLAFCHPYSGAPMEFVRTPPEAYPWNLFELSIS